MKCLCVWSSLQTWWPVHGQVSEVAALDELHRHSSRCGIVGETHQQFRNAAVCQRLSWWSAVALRHGRQAELGVDTLRNKKKYKWQIRIKHKYAKTHFKVNSTLPSGYFEVPGLVLFPSSPHLGWVLVNAALSPPSFAHEISCFPARTTWTWWPTCEGQTAPGARSETSRWSSVLSLSAQTSCAAASWTAAGPCALARRPSHCEPCQEYLGPRSQRPEAFQCQVGIPARGPDRRTWRWEFEGKNRPAEMRPRLEEVALAAKVRRKIIDVETHYNDLESDLLLRTAAVTGL